MSEDPPFIQTQGMRLLQETERPERFLRAEYFRAGRAMGPAGGEDRGRWAAVNRFDVVRNAVEIDKDSPCDLSRLVVTTDAGVGKTITMQWLNAELNRPDSSTAAFFLTFSRMPEHAADLIPESLLPQFAKPDDAGAPPPTADDLHMLEQLRAEGRVVLLLDGLDQAPPDGAAVRCLRALLDDPLWRRCRIVVSGRPYALQRHWAELFDAELGFGWRFLQMDEFDEREQRVYLDDDRFEAIPIEAREILATPRVLKYLRDVPDTELGQIRTAGDVYWRSVNHLLKDGMKNAEAARKMGLAADERTPAKVQSRSLARARKLLGAIGFEMTATLVCRSDTSDDTGQKVPNFDGVPPNRFESFKGQLTERLSQHPGDEDRQLLDRDIDSLAALNEFLLHGIFDTDVDGLDRFYWRSRTLQEFFAAFWLAQYCTPDDAGRLWDWIYRPEEPLTEEYYWVWRFLCEMHEDARDPNAWTRAIQPVYRPGDGTVAGTKRSSEMIYRAWQPLELLAGEGIDAACEVRAKFLGEFENDILSGDRGAETKEIAVQFCASFKEVPAGKFRMGAPPEKQGMPEDEKQRWKAFLEQEGDPEERAEGIVAGWTYAPTKQGQELRESQKQRLIRVLRSGDIVLFENLYYAKNETPEKSVKRVDGFLLSRWPTVNHWYRLFQPGHGETESYYQQDYTKISPAPDTPVIFVTWYDAWAFCLWAHWEGRSCRLPREYEWEYAAKAGTPWDWNYWWGDDFDEHKCNADRRVGRTAPPNATHANAWGSEDILGNVWEWCQERYCERYDRDKPPDRSARALRGGSWHHRAACSRSAYRGYGLPLLSNACSGFRVARALE